ncbi:MAG: hypothetical protein QM535_19255, partial [Limnohabitans sp.]|nr:hypothetical protein [Limnohabitans sp.]
NASMVFTTNIFENYDKAFFRRILYHVPFESPGFEERKKIWQYHFVSEVPKEISYDEFSNITDTLSGGDIKNIALKLILRLQSGKIKTITECDLRNELESYKQNLNKLQTTNYILNIKNQN